MVATTIARMAGGIVTAGQRLGNPRSPIDLAMFTTLTVPQHGPLALIRFVAASQVMVGISIATMMGSVANSALHKKLGELSAMRHSA